ncbi:unnamed protein product, partial [Prunus brigantina]
LDRKPRSVSPKDQANNCTISQGCSGLEAQGSTRVSAHRSRRLRLQVLGGYLFPGLHLCS